VIRKSYAALRNFVTSLPNPNPMLSGQVESESESEKTGSDPHHCICLHFIFPLLPSRFGWTKLKLFFGVSLCIKICIVFVHNRWNMSSIQKRIRKVRSGIRGPDPYKNLTDPEHCFSQQVLEPLFWTDFVQTCRKFSWTGIRNSDLLKFLSFFVFAIGFRSLRK
jgi:hypothetical protein